MRTILLSVLAIAGICLALPGCGGKPEVPVSQPATRAADTGAHALDFLNVSYDPTRELYQQINPAFVADFKAKTGQNVTIQQSHGASGKQSRAVVDGLDADVVTLALAADIDSIAAKGKLLPANWQQRLPENSTPYTSTIVFLVRKGNPKGIHDWDDLIRGDVRILLPNPKVSGGARWTYLAAYGQELLKSNDDAKARAYVKAFFQHAPVLANGTREATLQLTKQEVGDVLVNWENEAYLALKEFGADKFEIITPSVSILAEPPVAVLDVNVKKHGTEKVAEAYLNFLYTPEAQEIIAKNYYRPRDAGIIARYAGQFPPVKLFTIDQLFGGWRKVQAAHFADGGVFDQITGTGGAKE